MVHLVFTCHLINYFSSSTFFIYSLIIYLSSFTWPPSHYLILLIYLSFHSLPVLGDYLCKMSAMPTKSSIWSAAFEDFDNFFFGAAAFGFLRNSSRSLIKFCGDLRSWFSTSANDDQILLREGNLILLRGGN